jgi:hypothetical protein
MLSNFLFLFFLGFVFLVLLLLWLVARGVSEPMFFLGRLGKSFALEVSRGVVSLLRSEMKTGE